MTKSILIVDDDQDIQGILQRILEEEGYTVGQIPVEPDRDFASWNGRRKAISFSMLFVLFVLWLPRAQTASADGGAPDLAYVAGTAPGVSVIDVAQQHVSRTLFKILPKAHPRKILKGFHQSDWGYAGQQGVTPGKQTKYILGSGGTRHNLV